MIGSLLIKEIVMAKTTDLPTEATLMRFSINPDKLPEGFEIWTLDFPFGSAVWQYKNKVEQRLNEKRNVPYRQLNNALMTVCPNLTHGFEYAGKGNPYRALAVGLPLDPAQLPDPENIRHIIREWAQLWTESSYIVNNIPEDERMTMRDKLIFAINDPVNDWCWKSRPANQLLKSFNPSEVLNYTALPSLMAAILHGKTSTIHEKQIQWRKVQDKNGSNNKLAIVGFINQRPIHASFAIQEFQMSDSGEGYGAYKLEFNLETQAGRTDPWMFVSLHVQRYGHIDLTHPNDRRRVSVLTAANRARLDDFPVDSTLVKLQTREINNSPDWDDYLVELLERIGASNLEAPSNIFAYPQNYWRPLSAGADYSEDEYYIVHAEGYGYGEGETGHELRPGLSMTDSGAVFDSILNEYLIMLEKDVPLETDIRPFSNVKIPRAMRDHQFMSRTKTLQPDEVEKMIDRALRGQEMQIVILWNNEHTRDGINKALKKALLLKSQESLPSNITIADYYVEKAFLEPIDRGNFKTSYEQRIQDWKKFLELKVPRRCNCFAIVEMLSNSWKVKDSVRTACVKEDITSQMVRSVRLKANDLGQQIYLGGKGNHEHRANSVAREVVLRHIGGIYGDPQEVYKAAGIKEQNLEIVAFFLKQTQGNISFPIAAKLAFDGAVEVTFPGQNEWFLYGNAAPKLGQIFAKERVNITYNKTKRKNEIRDDKKKYSTLYYEKGELNNFIFQALRSIRYPTLVVIEANKWRNTGVWPQLRNPDLLENWNVLNFEPYNLIERDNPQFKNLLAVIRMRSGQETPQYLTNTEREFTQLTGAIDASTGNLMHYFSIGCQLVTSKGQRYSSTRHATLLDDVGAGVAYKYPQVVEFVPFFVRHDYQDLESLKKLCRIPHYLRLSPAWPQGNIVLPYPMHLAHELIKDQLCILGMDA